MSGQVDALALKDVIARAIDDLDQSFLVITALLRLAEIENGQRRAGFTTVNLGELVTDAVDLYEPMAETKSIAITALVPDEAIMIHGDRHLLIELLANLMDNAIKFTPDGGIITVIMEESWPYVNIKVKDTGIGIAKTERSSVLGRFYRSDKSRHVPGIGLGLSLVSAIAHLHGAELSIHAASSVSLNPGTVFKLVFHQASTSHGARLSR